VPGSAFGYRASLDQGRMFKLLKGNALWFRGPVEKSGGSAISVHVLTKLSVLGNSLYVGTSAELMSDLESALHNPKKLR